MEDQSDSDLFMCLADGSIDQRIVLNRSGVIRHNKVIVSRRW